MLPPVISALLTFVAALFRSHACLHLENLALRHQLAVYQQTVPCPRLRSTERLLWVWLFPPLDRLASSTRLCPAPHDAHLATPMLSPPPGRV